MNLVIMTFMWSSCAFNYYMVMFQLKYWPGNIFTNTIAAGFGELLADVAGGVIYSKLRIKKTFSIIYLISIVGGLLIIFWGEELKTTLWMPFFVILAKFGISAGFTVVYVSMVDIFPTLFVSTSMGICNFVARVITIAAPQVAELQAPLPMSLFVSLCATGIVLIQFVKPLESQKISLK